MKTQNTSKRQSVKTGILYGTGSACAILISRMLTLDSNSKYTGNLLTTALTFGILIGGIILCCKVLSRIGQFKTLSVEKVVLSGVFFSLSIGLIACLTHYINASFIDTQYAQHALEASRAKWAANNYSREAIAGQVELTGTFQIPWKWAVTSGIFMTVLSLFLFATTGFFYRIIRNQNIDQAVA